MKLLTSRLVSVGVLVAGVTSAYAKTIPSDLSVPEKRRTFVEQISRLARPAKPAPLPADLALPFNPPGFDRTEAQERAMAAASQSSLPPKVLTDRDTLEEITSQIAPSGSMRDKNGEPVLAFADRMFKRGTRFTVDLRGQAYELVLTRIDATTFTLRLNNEEITRPIKPAKSP